MDILSSSDFSAPDDFFPGLVPCFWSHMSGSLGGLRGWL